MKTLSAFAFLLATFSLHAQLNISLIGHLDVSDAHNTEASDIWGYVDGSGNEYAIVGLNNGTCVVDISDPSNPIEIFFEPGSNSVWRDIKTWGNYAYVTTEANDGLLIIDLTSLPNASGISTSYYFGPATDQWNSAHNLYIDENGVAYIFGADRDNGGCIMLDVDASPTSPVELGSVENWYAHDGVTRGDTLYMGHINDGFMSVFDVSDKTNPVLLGSHNTPGNFSHNIWQSDNNNYAFTTDEIPNGFIGALDISNPANISITDQVQSSPGTNVIPHNTHFIDDFIVTSYYRDGVVIHDVQDPYNMIEVGNYDTSPLSGDGFNGCWGVYPWLPSGLIIASDVESGLYILSANYVRGCYLEGHVSESGSGSSIANAEITILSAGISENSNLAGDYKTGVGVAGSYNVQFSKPGYVPQTIPGVNLLNGDTTVLNVQLVPLVPFNITGNVMKNGGGSVAGATIVIGNEDFLYTAYSDGSGNFTISGVYEDTFDITVGRWGYVTECYNDVIINGSTGSLNYSLKQGYYDDFSLDFSWTVSGNASTGAWERGDPVGTEFFGNEINPEDDVTGDCGEQAFVTGNGGGQAGSDDVDDGNAILTSPVFDATIYTFPQLRFHRWWANGGGSNAGDDTIRFSITDGTNTVILKELDGADLTMMSWVEEKFMISDYITPGPNMQFIVETADWASGDGHLVEGGLDNFMIVETLGEEEISTSEVSVFPNPFNNHIVVEIHSELRGSTTVIRDIAGREVKQIVLTSGRTSIDLSEPDASGMYFLTVYHKERTRTFKIIKN